MSLRWRLSWLLAMTAVLTVSAFGLFAYFAARASAIQAAHARLRSTLVQINAITELGAINQLETLRTVASHPAVIEALRHAHGGVNGEMAPEVEEALHPLRGLSLAAQAAAVVELADEAGAARYVLPYDEPAPGRQSSLSPTPDGVVGPFYARAGVLHFQSAISLGQGLGGIRVTRRLGASRRISVL